MTHALIVATRAGTVALNLAEVLEIVELGDLTPIPSAPAAVRGLTSVRGQVFPVVDLAAFLSDQDAIDPNVGMPLVLVQLREAAGDPAALKAALVVERVVELGAAHADVATCALGNLFSTLTRGAAACDE